MRSILTSALLAFALLSPAAFAEEPVAPRVLPNMPMGEALATMKATAARAAVLGGQRVLGTAEVKCKAYPDTTEARQEALVPMCRLVMELAGAKVGLPVLAEEVYVGGSKCGFGRSTMGCYAVALVE